MEGADEGSRKSSTDQPGNVSIKYSDILLVETEQLSLMLMFSSTLFGVDGIEYELKISLETEARLLFVFFDVVVVAVSQQLDDEEIGYKEEGESLTPVRRNLLWFLVYSLAL